MGLGLLPPWEVREVKLEETSDGKELHIYIDLKRGSRFDTDKCDSVAVYST